MKNTTTTTTQNDAVSDLALRAGLWLGKVLALFVAPLALFWWLTGYLTGLELRLFVAGLAYLLPVLFLLGMQYGRTEARGMVSGIDTALGKLAAAIDLRDNTRARAAAQRQATATRPGQAAQFNVYLPDVQALTGPVPITRRDSNSGEVVDL